MNDDRLGRVTFEDALDLLESDDESGSENDPEAGDDVLPDGTSDDMNTERSPSIEGVRIVDVRFVAPS